MRPVLVSFVALTYYGLYSTVLSPIAVATSTTWKFVKQPPEQTGISTHFGSVYQRVDKRIQHVIKWVFSVGDAAATGDVDGDGKPDLFLTSVLMRDDERAGLYLNKGGFEFQRHHIPELEARFTDIETYGLPTNAMFVDYNNCGCLCLFITTANGSPVLLRNRIKETGRLEFEDVTVKAGLNHYTNSIAATWTDLNRDGLLDLVIVNVPPNTIPDYDTPKELNFFQLPQPEYPGDERMFHFMHKSWHSADNGGANEIWLQQADHTFIKQDNKVWNFEDTRWSLAVGAADLNRDGWPDLYIANDFGPDDLYYNMEGKSFKQIKGDMFGSIGRDTYKGMNVSIADFDRNGFQDVSVSNVHHALQAEGSLLWMFGPSKNTFFPEISDKATYHGMLNENRFGWGASASDFDNDGWIDLAQANGMVDDSIDKQFESCPDYWYTNEKIARSPPSIHSYANRWGDIRGYCIYGKERNRLYLNRGTDAKPMFTDVAEQVGLTDLTNSRGIAAADFDSTGRRGMVVTHMFSQPTIYKNEGPLTDSNQWVGFDLDADGITCNRSGIGSIVTLSYEQHGRSVSQTLEKQVATGFEAQNEPRLHFGLGQNAKNLQVKVKWCGGKETSSTSIRINSYQTLRMNE